MFFMYLKAGIDCKESVVAQVPTQLQVLHKQILQIDTQTHGLETKVPMSSVSRPSFLFL